MFVGSDAIALSAMTNKITYLEEGDYAFVTRNSIEIFNAENITTQRKIEKIDLETTNLGKAGHKHFMSKEIAEQPTVLRNAISHYLNQAESTVNLKEKNLNFEDVDRIVMIACGTAFYACQVAKYWMEKISNIPVEIDIASEFRYRESPISNKTLAIFVSQSGETADTLAALRYCKEKTKKNLSIVNVSTSSISRESDISLPIMAGTEIGVASTKAFTSQLLTLATLCISAGMDKNLLKKEEQVKLVQDLIKLPNLITTALLQESEISKIAKKISFYTDVLFMGRGALYPIALEGALKLKEISYIHAEGYASGELKHGPIALIDENIPVVVFAPFDALFDKTISNMQEVLARNGQVILITDAKGSRSVGQDVKDKIIMPSFDSIFAPIIYAIPAQLLAYHAAIAKGTDVDQPRNLAKSVTVE
jgi:glucosamine--fructose-6-phosphate aminotransferase (isomerizing)